MAEKVGAMYKIVAVLNVIIGVANTLTMIIGVVLIFFAYKFIKEGRTLNGIAGAVLELASGIIVNAKVIGSGLIENSVGFIIEVANQAISLFINQKPFDREFYKNCGKPNNEFSALAQVEAENLQNYEALIATASEMQALSDRKMRRAALANAAV